MVVLHVTVNFSLIQIKAEQKITQSFSEVLNKEAKTVTLTVNFIFMCGTIAYFGIAANIINLLNFAKQGFENTINICLFGIAISDLCTLITVLWLGICVNPLLQTDEISFEEIEYLTAGWPHCLFARITCMITVYMTIERCLCVTLPLKVKHIITKTNTIVTVVSIFVSQLLTAIPTYYSAHIGWKYHPEMNKSVLGLCRADNWERVEFVSFILQAIMQGGSFVLLVLFTIVLVVNIQKTTKWRKYATSKGQNKIISNRDKKLVRMIVLISVILIACFTPGMTGFIGMSFVPEYTMGGKYDNLFWVTWSFVFVFQSANSSVNILVYYNMSTKYRVVFNEMYYGCRKRLRIDSERSTKDADDLRKMK